MNAVKRSAGAIVGTVIMLLFVFALLYTTGGFEIAKAVFYLYAMPLIEFCKTVLSFVF